MELLLVEIGLMPIKSIEALLCRLPIDNVPHRGEVFGFAVLILQARQTSVMEEIRNRAGLTSMPVKTLADMQRSIREEFLHVPKRQCPAKACIDQQRDLGSGKLCQYVFSPSGHFQARAKHSQLAAC